MCSSGPQRFWAILLEKHLFRVWQTGKTLISLCTCTGWLSHPCSHIQIIRVFHSGSNNLTEKNINVDLSAQADSHPVSHLPKTHFLVYGTFLYVSQFHHMGRTVYKPYNEVHCELRRKYFDKINCTWHEMLMLNMYAFVRAFLSLSHLKHVYIFWSVLENKVHVKYFKYFRIKIPVQIRLRELRYHDKKWCC